MGTVPLVEEFGHFAGQVLDYGQVAQRLDGQGVIVQHLLHMSTTGPARFTVDRHGAGATHTDAAREAVAQFRIEVTLDPGNHVEDGLAFE